MDHLPEAVIAVMGATGSGKSTFINLISGSNLEVSEGLKSCTINVDLGSAFNLDGYRVTLIDTPGFDDTTRSDTDVLNAIALFLAATYEQGSKLAGVLYFHRISDFRMGGTSTKNFKMFRKLCGDNTLQNVVIVTNMWGEVTLQKGEAREAELKSEDIFFRPVLAKGALMARHENNVTSAQRIIRLVLDNPPLALRIQEELVTEKKEMSGTSAGEELNREFDARIKKYQEEIRTLKEEMDAMKHMDEETRKEFEMETQKLRKEIARVEDDAKKLASDYTKEKAKIDARLKRMRSDGFFTSGGRFFKMFRRKK